MKSIWFGLTATAALGFALLMPGGAQAQRYGGWRGGGWGYSSWPGYSGGWGVRLGYGSPYYGSAYYPRSYGYSYYPGSYGYSHPYYARSSYYTPYLGSYYSYAPSSAPSSASNVQPSDTYVGPTTTPSGFAASAAPAAVEVRLPDRNAEVWIDNERMPSNGGSTRVFRTAPFDGNRSFNYDVTARWNEDGRRMERTRTVTVRGGDRATVDFTQPNP
jgi:uncharacterized protein (TIGR03000 family)